MSSYVKQVNSYCERFNVPLIDRWKLYFAYPFFKLSWLRNQSKGILKNILIYLDWPFAWPTISNTLYTPDNQAFLLKIDFRSAHLDSFREIFWGEEYSVNENMSSARTLIDLGGNTGMVPAYFATRCNLQQIVIVEANQQLIKDIKRSTQGLTDNTKVSIELACISGQKQGNIRFYLARNHRMSTTTPIPDAKTVDVPLLPLRQLLQKYQLNSVDILKMDIEGSEFDILSEDPQVFTLFKYLFIEIHGDEEKRTYFHQKMKTLGAKLIKQHIFPEYRCETSVFKMG